MNTHVTKSPLEQAIVSIPFEARSTHTNLGLDFVRTNAFTQAHGDRPGVPNYLILLTDGKSWRPVETKIAAEAIHRTNINVIAVGIGNLTDQNELEIIASSHDRVLSISSFNNLAILQDNFQRLTCVNTSTAPTLPPITILSPTTSASLSPSSGVCMVHGMFFY